MTNVFRCLSLVFLLSLNVAAVAANDDERSMRAIENRQGLLKVTGHYMGPIVGMARGQIPFDADVIAHHATQIGHLTGMLPDLFRMDTRGSSAPTEAKGIIWDNLEDFAAKAKTSQDRAQALVAATSEGKGPTLKAFGALGNSCKGCHDKYREKK